MTSSLSLRHCLRSTMLMLSAALLFHTSAWGQRDTAGPALTNISLSNEVVVISDCLSTAVTITVQATDASKITTVRLWYRIGSDQPFASIDMKLIKGLYTAELEGVNLQGHGYGPVEFYIAAEDEWGNSSKSPLDSRIQFLPCVSH